MRTRSRLAGALPCLVLLLLIRLWLPGHPAMAAPALLEELRYRLEVLSWQDAARVKLTLNRLGPGRFVAEVIGEPQGLIKLLSGGQRERLQTEMVWRNHRLLPLIYREESWRREETPPERIPLRLFPGPAGIVGVAPRQGAVEKMANRPLPARSMTPCPPSTISAWGLSGPTREGETNTIQGIPYPRPEAMEVRLGADDRVRPPRSWFP